MTKQAHHCTVCVLVQHREREGRYDCQSHIREDIQVEHVFFSVWCTSSSAFGALLHLVHFSVWKTYASGALLPHLVHFSVWSTYASLACHLHLVHFSVWSTYYFLFGPFFFHVTKHFLT